MMKRTLVVLAAVHFCSICNCQLTKKNWMIGGSLSFSSQKTQFPLNESKSTQFGITPKIGYFLADKWALGILGSFNYDIYSVNNIKSKTTTYGIGSFMRYYFLTTENKYNIQTECYASYNNSKNNLQGKGGGFYSYGTLVGPVVYFNSSVGIELLLGYRGYKEISNSTRNNGFHLNLGIQVHLESEN